MLPRVCLMEFTCLELILFLYGKLRNSFSTLTKSNYLYVYVAELIWNNPFLKIFLLIIFAEPYRVKPFLRFAFRIVSTTRENLCCKELNKPQSHTKVKRKSHLVGYVYVHDKGIIVWLGYIWPGHFGRHLGSL